MEKHPGIYIKQIKIKEENSDWEDEEKVIGEGRTFLIFVSYDRIFDEVVGNHENCQTQDTYQHKQKKISLMTFILVFEEREKANGGCLKAKGGQLSEEHGIGDQQFNDPILSFREKTGHQDTGRNKPDQNTDVDV